MRACFKYVVLALAVLLLASCDDSFRKTRVLDAKVESVSPQGLRAMEAEIGFTVENPGNTFTLSDISVVAKYRRTRCIEFTCPSVTVQGGTRSSFSVPVRGNLDPEFSFRTFLGFFSGGFDVNEFNLDIQATVTTGRQKQKIKYKDVPASKITKNI